MPLTVGILCFPRVQQLDLTGPYEVFASTPGLSVHLVAKTQAPLRSATGLQLTPDTTFQKAPNFDILCVPGGAGINTLLTDQETLDFVRRQAASARVMTSVCTGSLVLGAAGLLAGKKATSHWNALDFLPHFGAIPCRQRVVTDGTLITAGGVTSGIDFALTVVATLFDTDTAEAVQLALEYDPEPPFSSGTPDQARPEIVDLVRSRLEGSREERMGILGLKDI